MRLRGSLWSPPLEGNAPEDYVHDQPDDFRGDELTAALAAWTDFSAA
jgi:hypothetical protein